MKTQKARANIARAFCVERESASLHSLDSLNPETSGRFGWGPVVGMTRDF